MGIFKSDEKKLEELVTREKRLRDKIGKKRTRKEKKSGARYYLGHRIDFG